VAARDESLDKLEAFIAATAEARASAQRGGASLERLRGRLSDLEDQAERKLQGFEDEVEELAERAAPRVETHLPLIGAVAGGFLFGPLGAVAGAMAGVAASPRHRDRLAEDVAELREEWPALGEELQTELPSDLEEEARDVAAAVRELMDALAEEDAGVGEDQEEVLQAFEEVGQVLENGAGAAS
jgi:gas vesicle protein